VPNFITEIDGLDIHFIHFRSNHEDALPLIVTHGWPGSVIEQLKIIEPLTNPTAHGGSAADAFHVVIPSIPGYGFSGKPTTTGWGPERIASAWITLIRRLGYKPFVAQGGDWGAVITDMIGVQAPPELLGIHTNMPGAIPTDIDQASIAGASAPSGLSNEEKSSYDQLVFFYKQVYYAFWMGTRPQTMAYWPRDLLDRPRRAQSGAHRALIRWGARGPHAGRRPRQRHAVLADEHRRFGRTTILGEQARVFQPQGRHGSGCCERVPG
jgi:pimeloyl-ACP methyl ester carboxylesterase